MYMHNKLNTKLIESYPILKGALDKKVQSVIPNTIHRHKSGQFILQN